jgi:hypothetical protein
MLSPSTLSIWVTSYYRFIRLHTVRSFYPVIWVCLHCLICILLHLIMEISCSATGKNCIHCYLVDLHLFCRYKMNHHGIFFIFWCNQTNLRLKIASVRSPGTPSSFVKPEYENVYFIEHCQRGICILIIKNQRWHAITSHLTQKKNVQELHINCRFVIFKSLQLSKTMIQPPQKINNLNHQPGSSKSTHGIS